MEPGCIAIVPGLSVENGAIPDVMRGEETQVFGALQILGLSDARLVLPGTHSKWVAVKDHQITDFSTWMTGEFYALLRQHSILSGLVIGEELRCQRLASGDTVIIMGAEALAARYEQAPGLLGVSCRQVGSEASWLGLRAIADTLTAAQGNCIYPRA